MKQNSKTKSVLKATLAILLTLVLLAGCSTPAANPPATTTTPPATAGDTHTGDDGEEHELFTLRVITQPIFNEVITADELGFFADEGIKIEYIGTVPTGVTEFQLLEQGEIDAFVSTHPPQVGQARVAGVKAVSVAPGSRDTREYPHIHYLVQNDSDIQSLDDLFGRQIGVASFSACTNGFVDTYLTSVKPDFTEADVEYILIGQSLEQALIQGLVDVITSHNPAAGVALATGEVREIASSSDILQEENFSLASRGFTEDFMVEHPEVVQGFVNAMYRGRLWINNNLDDAIQLNAYLLGVDPANITAVVYEEAKNNVPEAIDRWVEFGEAVGNWEPGAIKAEDIYSLEFVPEDAPASDATLRWERPAE
jgi:ABC-type nitrate/sulfonate/bicarbonate transport system substrate-binding protein